MEGRSDGSVVKNGVIYPEVVGSIPSVDKVKTLRPFPSSVPIYSPFKCCRGDHKNSLPYHRGGKSLSNRYTNCCLVTNDVKNKRVAVIAGLTNSLLLGDQQIRVAV